MTNKTIVVCEYVWIGGEGELRSKTRILDAKDMYLADNSLNTNRIPVWNYDGSSTKQANSDGNTEVILRPCGVYVDPFRKGEKSDCRIILCDTYDTLGNPLLTNSRDNAAKIFDEKLDEVPWFGLEQEYFLVFNAADKLNAAPIPEGLHYCGRGSKLERMIVEKHLTSCLYAGLAISGINAEVSQYQWEFQIGPCVGIDAADQLIVARYIMERVVEMYNVEVSYFPKPSPDINGSGCHVNFSTQAMREFGGIRVIDSCMAKLGKKHEEHIRVYGEHNELRLTGKHETSDIKKFTYGVGTRNTSVRIPTQTFRDGWGYFEDRRPAANIDPYKATSIVFETCCLER